ncbi:hypothetical protein [Georgenia alba]|uniref:Septum formation-related domain-containing protein n=1 Tax=Georgenia alba TaxID=2233858 RepID=A0ABW2QA30_9MICO
MPDARRGGAWIDQGGSYVCPNGASWHIATPSSGGPRAVVIAAAVGGGLVVVVALVLVLTQVIPTGSGSPDPTSAEPSPADGAAPEGADSGSTASETPAPEGAPVLCAEGSLHNCFPDPAVGPQSMDHLESELDWTCWDEGERDAQDNPVTRTRQCGADDPAGNHDRVASIGYDADPDSDLVTGFWISTDVTADAGRNQEVTRENLAELTATVTDFAWAAIWPDDADIRSQMREAFFEVHQRCANLAADPTDGATASIPLGYEVTCFNVEEINVTVNTTIQSYFMNVTVQPVAPEH